MSQGYSPFSLVTFDQGRLNIEKRAFSDELLKQLSPGNYQILQEFKRISEKFREEARGLGLQPGISQDLDKYWDLGIDLSSREVKRFSEVIVNTLRNVKEQPQIRLHI